MIKNEIERLQEKQASSRISEEEFEEWKKNRITKRFFLDIELDYYDDLDVMIEMHQGSSGYAASMGSISAGARTKENIMDYEPEEVTKMKFSKEGKEKDDIQE